MFLSLHPAFLCDANGLKPVNTEFKAIKEMQFIGEKHLNVVPGFHEPQ